MRSVSHQLPLQCYSERDHSIQAAFEQFDREHPDIYREFRRISYEIAKKRQRYGAKAIFEILRYHRLTSAHGSDDDFAPNNNYSSRYARKLIAEDPDTFGHFFELRELRSA